MTDIWDEKPKKFTGGLRNDDDSISLFNDGVYLPEDMDAWLEKLRGHYNSVEAKAEKWEKLVEVMGPFGARVFVEALDATHDELEGEGGLIDA